MAHSDENKQNSSLKQGVMVTFTIFCGLLSLLLLLLLLSGSGDTSAVGSSQGGSYALMDQFDMAVGNALSDALEGIRSVKKVYFLPDDSAPAPRPDPEKMGSCASSGEMEEILGMASRQFDGEKFVFSKDTELLPGSAVRYYLDDSIFSVSWKQPIEGCVYSFAEVRIGHPSQFRRLLSGGSYGSGVLYTPSQMAASANAVTASSGDYYAYRSKGVVVHDGTTFRVRGDRMDTCFIDDQGDLLLLPANAHELDSVETVQAYVDDHHVRFGLCFGPILLENGELIRQQDYPVGEIFRNYSRAALCQQGKLHYLLVTANLEHGYPNTPTIPQFARNLQKMGIQRAYALDGGQTATLIANEEIVNKISYGNERKVSDIIYFATAIPEKKEKGDPADG